MAKKEVDEGGGKVGEVLQLLRRRTSFTLKQEKFCSRECVERFLKAKGGNVRKAARQLKSCISWRESSGTEILNAEEFAVEISEGVAYVAGLDEESRPVAIFRSKQELQKIHWHKSFIRLFTFTLEVAIGMMTAKVQQFVLLFDASFFRSASTFLGLMLIPALKIVADYYPSRLFKAFVVDPPSLFSYLWKGARAFVELSRATAVVSSSAVGASDSDVIYPSSSVNVRLCSSGYSSRFTFAVSDHHGDSLKPWYLTTSETPSCSLNRRSFSFAGGGGVPTPPPPQTPSSFLPSPAMFCSRSERWTMTREKKKKKKKKRGVLVVGAFVPYLNLYRRQYDGVTYRSMIKFHGHSDCTRRRHVLCPRPR